MIEGLEHLYNEKRKGRKIDWWWVVVMVGGCLMIGWGLYDIYGRFI